MCEEDLGQYFSRFLRVLINPLLFLHAPSLCSVSFCVYGCGCFLLVDSEIVLRALLLVHAYNSKSDT